MKPSKKTVRIYTPFLPDNLNEGAFHVIQNQVRALEKLNFEVEIVHWKKKETESPIKQLKRVIKSLYSDFASPEEYFYPAADDPAKSITRIADYGIYHFSFCYNWLKSKQKRPEKKTAVHFHNLESDLFQLRMKTESRRAPWRAFSHHFIHHFIHQVNSRKLKIHEQNLAFLADELWFLSAVDHEKFNGWIKSLGQEAPKQVRRCQIRTISPSFDTEIYARRSLDFLEIQQPQVVVGIIGKFDFEPNRASLEWILKTLAPILEAKNFQGKIQVVGSGVPQSLLKEAERYSFIEVLGFVPDLENFWANLSFMLVPQKGGSGVRIKLLEAMGSGVPVLANSQAVAPINPHLKKSPLLICLDSPFDWADRLIQEKPFSTRSAIKNQKFEAALDGSEIYRFLMDDSI